MKLSTHKLSLAGACTAAISMLTLSVLNALGVYQVAAEQMMAWHMFYTPDLVGTIAGMLEAALVTYVVLFIFGWFYNKMDFKQE